MERIPPTRQIALKIWWAFTWRALLLVLGAGFVVGIVLGLIGSLAGIEPETMGGISSVMGLFLGVDVSIEVMYRILKKRFQGFEIALIRGGE